LSYLVNLAFARVNSRCRYWSPTHCLHWFLWQKSLFWRTDLNSIGCLWYKVSTW
jgi:hypothetical protein